MSSIDIFKLRDILMQDIDYNYALDELLKLNNGYIKTDDPACPLIIEKNLYKATETLISIVYRTNPLVSDNTVVLNVKKLVILYYVFIMAINSIQRKTNFRLPSGLDLVTKRQNWGRTELNSGYTAVIQTGSNPSVDIYFIVGANKGGGNKKIYLKSYVNNYDIENNEIILACGDEKREYIRQHKTKLELINLNLIFDLLQSIYDKLK